MDSKEVEGYENREKISVSDRNRMAGDAAGAEQPAQHADRPGQIHRCSR